MHCCRQNPGLKDVDLESITKRVSDKINMEKHAWIHIWFPPLREVNVEPSAKRETNRTRAVVSLY